MKSIEDLLVNLARPEVLEFALASDRLPCVKVGGNFQPVDARAPTTETILQMLSGVGGNRYVDSLNSRPTQWSVHVERIGTVRVSAIMRNDVVQARFTLVERDAPLFTVSPTKPPSAAPPRTEPPGDAHDDDDDDYEAPTVLTKPPTPTSDDDGDEEAADRDENTINGPSVIIEAPASEGNVVHGSSSLGVLDELLAMIRETRGGDLHFAAGRPALFRIGGELVAKSRPIDRPDVERILQDILPERQRAMLANEGSCVFAFEHATRGRFRVSVTRQCSGQYSGLRACFRPVRTSPISLAALGLPESFAELTRHHQGLIAVAGAGGSGKTTTVAAIVDLFNHETDRYIVSVEDPVEYVHTPSRAVVSQREVGTHTPSFTAGVRSALSEHPDVLVLSHLANVDVARLALGAATSGTLVIVTLNAPSAARAVDRVLDSFPPAEQASARAPFAGALRLVTSQRLLPCADGKGLAVATEVLPWSLDLYQMVREGKTSRIPQLYASSRAGPGLSSIAAISMNASLTELVRTGRITAEVASRVDGFPDDLNAPLRAKSARRSDAPARPPGDASMDLGGLLSKSGSLFGKKG